MPFLWESSCKWCKKRETFWFNHVSNISIFLMLVQITLIFSLSSEIWSRFVLASAINVLRFSYHRSVLKSMHTSHKSYKWWILALFVLFYGKVCICCVIKVMFRSVMELPPSNCLLLITKSQGKKDWLFIALCLCGMLLDGGSH